MQKPTLLILAAGMGSRYGGIKQMDHFGPNGETIIDYSIYDAIKSGFGKIVFIIRKDFADEFETIFNDKLKGSAVEIAYVYQGLESFIGEEKLPANRQKPWGTAHAVLCAKDAIKEPFAVINADDFYGREAFEKMVAFLDGECSEKRYSVMGYELGKTLSEHGSVSRGVCTVDGNGNLDTITERTKISLENGRPVYSDEEGHDHILSPATPVSMNFWGFHENVFKLTQEMFKTFLKENMTNPKAEFLIPTVVDYYIANRQGTVKVIPTTMQWFGVTYQEDAPFVRKNLEALIAEGLYPENLWS
ncbi:MAG TPA: sugar phosphate nucleotidyltransferase [Chitinophagaceae bacterium]|jgi:choline kinase|nr:sugar phosphate nucleotidyltransferase [Chitinophagaceae bacterium]